MDFEAICQCPATLFDYETGEELRCGLVADHPDRNVPHVDQTTFRTWSVVKEYM